jgi:hypothetical protein
MNPTPQRTLRWTMTWQRRVEQANTGDPDQRCLTIIIHETWTLSWVDEGAVGEPSLESQKSISLVPPKGECNESI